ncbi:MAG: hypothetical protein ABR500_02120 [Dermatophilaceae bacterium]|nr:hypothetical protein [Intrasporangiaceae bacterium]
MTLVVALGEKTLLDGYGLVGAAVHAAETDDDVRRIWPALAGRVGVVVLTPRAAAALGAALADPRAPMTAVLPA